MTSTFEHQWRLFDRLVDLPPGEQRRQLDAIAGLRPELREAVERLLAQDRDLGPGPDESAPGSEPGCPDEIGPYEILDRIGRGGMGDVYRARQTEPFERLVALKVVRFGRASQSLLRRFRREQRVLAAMTHRYVARVFDAGVTEKGLPFFAMELLNGCDLTEYCARSTLSVTERLVLFQRVCEGVQHAHEHGVVHRDLKPGNVLVVREGTEAVPKIVDFGLAKRFDGEASDSGLVTEVFEIVGTREYMAPEQAGGGSRSVDVRADVYSLGVILYELLCGALPFDSERLRGEDHAAWTAMVVRDEPLPPSRRLARLARRDQLAAERQQTVRSLRLELRRGLDWIVAKAMAKDPDERYASAQALAEDLQRWLEHRPVGARRSGWRRRIALIIRRHRAMAVGAALVAIAAVTGLAVHSVRAAEEREREIDGWLAAGRAKTRDGDLAAERLLQRAYRAREGDRETFWALVEFYRKFHIRRTLGDPSDPFVNVWIDVDGLHPITMTRSAIVERWDREMKRPIGRCAFGIELKRLDNALLADSKWVYLQPGYGNDVHVSAWGDPSIETVSLRTGGLRMRLVGAPAMDGRWYSSVGERHVHAELWSWSPNGTSRRIEFRVKDDQAAYATRLGRGAFLIEPEGKGLIVLEPGAECQRIADSEGYEVRATGAHQTGASATGAIAAVLWGREGMHHLRRVQGRWHLTEPLDFGGRHGDGDSASIALSKGEAARLGERTARLVAGRDVGPLKHIGSRVANRLLTPAGLLVGPRPGPLRLFDLNTVEPRPGPFVRRPYVAACDRRRILIGGGSVGGLASIGVITAVGEDLSGPTEYSVPTRVTGLAVHREDGTMAFGFEDRSEVWLRRFEANGEVTARRPLPGGISGCSRVAFSPCGRLLGAAGGGANAAGRVVVWRDPLKPSEPRVLECAGKRLSSLAFLDDRRVLAAGTDGRLYGWRLERRDAAPTESVPVSPDTDLRCLATMRRGDETWIATGSDNGSFYLWADADLTVAPQRVVAAKDPVFSIALTYLEARAEWLLAVGTAAGEISLWDPISGKRLCRLREPAHREKIYDLAFSPNGRLLIAAGKDTSEVYRITFGHDALKENLREQPWFEAWENSGRQTSRR